MLEGRVYIDETFIKVRKEDIKYKQGDREYRGISRNQMCIGIACDKMRTIAIYQGQGKTTKERTSQCFISHIKRGSTLIHDEEKAHDILVKELGLENRCYNARCCKSLSDKENPLYQINRRCFLLKRFLSSHSGFIRDDIQGYLDLFCFIMNEGENPYEKLEKLLIRATRCRKTLTFRDKFSK